MQAKRLLPLDQKIQKIKGELSRLEPMRPGTLSRQYRRPRQRQGAYYQISYTYRMKSHTEYAPKDQVQLARQEIAAVHAVNRRLENYVAPVEKMTDWKFIEAQRDILVEGGRRFEPAVVAVVVV